MLQKAYVKPKESKRMKTNKKIPPFKHYPRERLYSYINIGQNRLFAKTKYSSNRRLLNDERFNTPGRQCNKFVCNYM